MPESPDHARAFITEGLLTQKSAQLIRGAISGPGRVYGAAPPLR
ncbi:hypothetical protein [Streptomyces plumbiresistens]